MKRFVLVSLGLIGFGVIKASAAPLVTEAPIKSYGTPTTISVSTSAWTVVPAASTLAGRTGILVSVPATNSANIVAHLGSCTSTSIATTVRPMELFKGNGFTLVPVSTGACLYLLSLNTSAENVHVQEVGQ